MTPTLEPHTGLTAEQAHQQLAMDGPNVLEAAFSALMIVGALGFFTSDVLRNRRH